MTTKRFADSELTVVEKELAIALYLAHLISAAVLQRRQLFRKRALTNLITIGRYLHLQGFVRTPMIVTVTPFIKPQLHTFEVREDPVGQYFYFQAAMKAFIFSLSLRMIRATVTDSDAELQQPDSQRRVLMLTVIAPGDPLSINIRSGKP